jgi:hypothetical protein
MALPLRYINLECRYQQRFEVDGEDIAIVAKYYGKKTRKPKD